MNSRLQSLIDRGYEKEEVIKLSNFTEEDLEYASTAAFSHISKDCISHTNPSAIYIGGQPGSGKTILSMEIKNYKKDAVEIGIDNYRMYHPNYLEIEECIRNHWKNKIETINDTPGNDIADFTHEFAGVMTDRLIELSKNNNYNMILEWGMRNPDAPIKCMEDLKKNNYKNLVLFVATNKKDSFEACNLRADIMKNSRHIIRKVPKSFHDYCVNTLPESINIIYEKGKINKIIDYMSLVTRYGKVIWSYDDKTMPGDIFNKYVTSNVTISNNNELYALMTDLKEMMGLKVKIN